MSLTMHPEPTKIMMQPVSSEDLLSGLDPNKFIKITYYAPTYPDGATAIYPRGEVADWMMRWLGVSIYYINDARPPDHWDLLRRLRNAGWRVAVHNDYELEGIGHTKRSMTFWLLTHPGGYYVTGEGRTDLDALTECMHQAVGYGPVP